MKKLLLATILAFSVGSISAIAGQEPDGKLDCKTLGTTSNAVAALDVKSLKKGDKITEEQFKALSKEQQDEVIKKSSGQPGADKSFTIIVD